MFGKRFTYNDKMTFKRRRAINIIMNDDEARAFAAGCGRLADEFCSTLVNRMRDYEPYDDKERSFCGGGPLKNVVVFESEYPVFIEAMMEYIGILGVELEMSRSYTDLLEKQQGIIRMQHATIEDLRDQLESAPCEEDSETRSVISYLKLLNRKDGRYN